MLVDFSSHISPYTAFNGDKCVDSARRSTQLGISRCFPRWPMASLNHRYLVLTLARHRLPVRAVPLTSPPPRSLTLSCSLLPQFSISRVYTITVMSTLLTRTSLRRVLDSTEHASFATALREQTTDGPIGRIRVGVTTTMLTDDAHHEHDRVKDSHDIELANIERDGSAHVQWDQKQRVL